MATLQKIRDHAGTLVTIIIALALLAFIVGDLFNADGSFGSSRNNVGEINGNDVTIQEFQFEVDRNTENYKMNSQTGAVSSAEIDMIHDQTWNQFVRTYLFDEEYEKIGVAVGPDELFDMVQGNNIDPSVKNIPIFQNQESGEFDRNLVLQFLKNKDLDPSGEASASWASFERSLVANKKDQKFISLVGMGMYVTALQAEEEANAKNVKYDFDYVQLRYNTVSDSLIKVSESDIKQYYNNHKSEYEQKESRDLYYVSFPIVASEADWQATREWFGDIKKEFTEVSEEAIAQFVNLESEEPFNATYMSASDFADDEQMTTLFNSPDGTIVGPFEDGDVIKMAKKVKTARLPDSVEVRHILIAPSATMTTEAAKAKADSIFAEIKKGASFAEMAKQFSTDGSAQRGGELGWLNEGETVKPFNDFCFFGKKGDKGVVESQFGYHVIEIMNQSAASEKSQIAVIARKVVAGNKTVDDIYSKAGRFSSKNKELNAFRTNAEKEGVALRTANVKRDDKTLAGLENSRQIIRWAYKTKAGNISEIFELDGQFVIAIVANVHEDGIASLNDVRNDVMRRVVIEKKAEYLKEKMNAALNGASTLQAVANGIESEVQEAKNVMYSSYSIATIGYEPKLQAAMVALPEQQLSKPIAGNNGVYVIQVKQVQKSENDLDRERVMLQRSLMSKAGYQIHHAITEAADIEDNRADFY